MNKALKHSAGQTQKRTGGTLAENSARILDWRKKMSDHIAYGLLVYTGLQIFVTMWALKANHNSILPYFALVLLVFAIIPGCRLFEGQWSELSDEQAANPDLAGKFARDRAIVWAFAIFMPLILTGFFKGLSALFA